MQVEIAIGLYVVLFFAFMIYKNRETERLEKKIRKRLEIEQVFIEKEMYHPVLYKKEMYIDGTPNLNVLEDEFLKEIHSNLKTHISSRWYPEDRKLEMTIHIFKHEKEFEVY